MILCLRQPAAGCYVMESVAGGRAAKHDSGKETAQQKRSLMKIGLLFRSAESAGVT